MAIDVVRYITEENEFIWKFPSSELKLGTQVVVSPSQHAFFIKGGVIYDEFTEGTYTIKTENIPLLSKVINLAFGGATPFEGSKIFEDYSHKYLLSILSLEKAKYTNQSSMMRVAQVKGDYFILRC